MRSRLACADLLRPAPACDFARSRPRLTSATAVINAKSPANHHHRLAPGSRDSSHKPEPLRRRQARIHVLRARLDTCCYVLRATLASKTNLNFGQKVVIAAKDITGSDLPLQSSRKAKRGARLIAREITSAGTPFLLVSRPESSAFPSRRKSRSGPLKRLIKRHLAFLACVL